MNKVLTIAGMHRSGTSAMAGYMQQCGLDIGERLIGETYGNPRGHFEDVEIESIQENILKNQGIVLRIKPEFEIEFGQEQQKIFKRVVADRAHKEVWGWKDPRTCLFLEHWKAEIPQLKVVAVFRRWDAVLSSLVRRAQKQEAWWPKSVLVPKWHSGGNTWLMNRYLETWIRYNQDLLDFSSKHPGDIFFVQLGTAKSDVFWKHIIDKWEFPLEPLKLDSIFREGEFKTGSVEWKKKAAKNLADKAARVYRNLCKQEILAKKTL